MNYIYRINGNEAELINQSETVDKVIMQDTYPAREYHENTHAVLSYTEELGIHWEYIPFTPAELRERAYMTEKLITWGDELLTVDEANAMWQRYEAEGNEKAAELTELIAAAKADIRQRFPDAPEDEEPYVDDPNIDDPNIDDPNIEEQNVEEPNVEEVN